jgi:hypothetical protein
MKSFIISTNLDTGCFLPQMLYWWPLRMYFI